jgi:CheY-like chemotaxis protein
MSTASNYIKIILAEDDPDDSMLFLQALRDLKIQSDVEVFEDGVKFVSNINDQKIPDIIFLDMNMPMKNGLECLVCIRSRSDLSKTPVIIYSTSQNKKEIKLCYEKGANYYVVKPFTFEAISKMIEVFCSTNWATWELPPIKDFVVSFE